MLEVHAILQRQRCNENITKKTGTLSDAYLKYAARLLKEGEHNIGEIADMSGFSETKYFREVFKKYYRMSPSTYAKEGKSLSSVVVVEDEPEEEEATD